MYCLVCSNVIKLIVTVRGKVETLDVFDRFDALFAILHRFFLQKRRFKLSFCFLLFRFPWIKQRVSGSVEQILCQCSLLWEYLAPHQQLHVSPMRNGHGLSQYTEEQAVISVYTSIL